MAIIHRGHSSEGSISFFRSTFKVSFEGLTCCPLEPFFLYYGLGWLGSRGVYMALFSLCFLDFVCLCNRLPYGIGRNNFSFGKRQFLIIDDKVVEKWGDWICLASFFWHLFYSELLQRLCLPTWSYSGDRTSSAVFTSQGRSFCSCCSRSSTSA